MLHLGVITILPEMFSSLTLGVTGRAIAHGIAQLDLHNPRDWSKRAYRQIDDKPFGGGPGMVMMYEPLHASIISAKAMMPDATRVIYLSPQGRKIKQCDLNKIAQTNQSLLFIAGRYEGIDERIITHDVDEEWSLGDFVLSGGELAAMVYIDAIVRLLPGALGHSHSAQCDSFMEGLLDYPHYTRPASVNAGLVPAVLLEGNHREIERWRRKQSLGQTWLKRPDLLEEQILTEFDKHLLIEFQQEHGNF